MSLIYFCLWVIFNGRITLEIIVAGVIISLVLDQFIKRVLKLNLTASSFFMFLKLLPDILIYSVVLLVETVRANISLIKLVSASDIEVEPCLVKFNTPLKTKAARTALANSITLTPGAVTVSLNGNELLVHVLNRETAHVLEGSILERLLLRMEGRANA